MSLNPKFASMQKGAMPSFTNLGVEQFRIVLSRVDGRAEEAEKISVGQIVDRTVKTSKRDTPVRIYKPCCQGVTPVYIYIHGGGFIGGSPKEYDYNSKTICNNINCTVISIDYGLAPEHKFPEPLEECYEVVKWVYENSKELNIDPERIALGGDSAGANFTVALCLLARARKDFPIIYQVVACAPLDLTSSDNTPSKRELTNGVTPLTKEYLDWFTKCYVNSFDDTKNELASPLLAQSLEDLPAALVISAEYDPLRDEDELFAKRLSESGIDVVLRRFDGVPHTFYNTPIPGGLEEADEAFRLICSKLSEAFNK
jgi:acetyl esterase